jgi:FkbM family methyltransferase
MPFISYAQNSEDVVLWRALRDVEKGFYVDVGATDPEVDSISCAFYERGWSGINAQPVGEYFDKLARARPRDTNLKVAVGREPGRSTLHVSAAAGLSTPELQIAAQHQADGFQTQEYDVPVVTLTKILNDHAPHTVHFLKVQLEASETDALEGLDLDWVRPWIIIVGTTDSFSIKASRSNWERLITSRAYSFAYFNGLNCFYVADEVAALKEHLALPPNVLDDFVRWPEWMSRRKVAALERELAGLDGHARGLEEAFERATGHVERLETLLEATRTEAGNLRSVLFSEQAQTNQLRERVDRLATELAKAPVRWEIKPLLKLQWSRLREAGDRLSGGGVRALANRTLMPLLRRRMDKQPATIPDPASGLPPSGNESTAIALSASARSIYLRLQTAMSESRVRSRIR